jgi:S-adenosylmethionine-diacylglycerol 3-amino-3-carboxypropyl transferase
VGIANQIYDRWFNRTHRQKLIYNTCWEDPRVDRQLLAIDARSQIVMITSAGCNALDYLLDDPEIIHSVDLNPKQNALLELKIIACRHLPYDDFFKLFGEGAHPDWRFLYQTKLRPFLSHAARKIWDDALPSFDPNSRRGSFYFYGTSGDAAWYFHRLARHFLPTLSAQLIELFAAKNLEEQRRLYNVIEPRIFTPLMAWLCKQPLLLTLLGVPRAQRDLIVRDNADGVVGFIRKQLRASFTTVPIGDNYFWRVYLHGRYSKDCCPNYLREETFFTLKSRVNRIALHTKTLSQFLCATNAKPTHFVLLDHQDWLAGNAPQALEEEWQLILQRAEPAAKVLLRSAASHVDFIPETARHRLTLHVQPAAKLHADDRVGTYASTWFAQIEAQAL